MPLEIECSELRRRGDDRQDHYFRLLPGDRGALSYIKAVKVVTLYDVTGTVGHVWIRGEEPNNHIQVWLYEGENDEEGKPVDINPEMPLRITSQQELSIISRRVPRREILIYMETGESLFEEIPTDPEGSLIPVPV